MTRRPTIRDVAKAAGTSVGSVSRVLNGGPYASSELHNKVMRAVAKLGYEPDVVAQSMRLKSTKTIACLLADIANPLYAEIVNAAEERLQKEGYVFVLSTTRNDEERELAMISMVRRRRMDGMIVMASDETRKDVNTALAESAVPVVLIDREVPAKYDAVYVDHRGGAIDATRYLIGLGHKRIALLLPSEHVRPGRERAAGYRQALTEAGIAVDPDLIRPQKTSVHFAYADIEKLLQAPHPPTAIIVLGTRMLAGVMKTVSTRNLRIPEDLSLISIGDTDLTRFASPPITVVRWDLAELGRAAADLLIEQLNGVKRERPQHISLPTEFIIRGSCAPPKKQGGKRP